MLLFNVWVFVWDIYHYQLVHPCILQSNRGKGNFSKATISLYIKRLQKSSFRFLTSYKYVWIRRLGPSKIISSHKDCFVRSRFIYWDRIFDSELISPAIRYRRVRNCPIFVSFATILYLHRTFSYILIIIH